MRWQPQFSAMAQSFPPSRCPTFYAIVMITRFTSPFAPTMFDEDVEFSWKRAEGTHAFVRCSSG